MTRCKDSKREKVEYITQEKYEADFAMSDCTEDLDASEKCRKQKEALNVALDTRKFEIELYWKRATYFWALTAAAFTGYFAIKTKGGGFSCYILTTLGFIFSLAWFLANKGSKKWQENWEHHVDMLEDNIIGPLFKTTVDRRERRKKNRMELATSPDSYSVSKINNLLSLFVTALWLLLCLIEISGFIFRALVLEKLPEGIHGVDHRVVLDAFKYIALIIMSGWIIRWFFCGGRTSIESERKMKAKQRSAKIKTDD